MAQCRTDFRADYTALLRLCANACMVCFLVSVRCEGQLKSYALLILQDFVLKLRRILTTLQSRLLWRRIVNLRALAFTEDVLLLGNGEIARCYLSARSSSAQLGELRNLIPEKVIGHRMMLQYTKRAPGLAFDTFIITVMLWRHNA
jgi:hypothetical protein